MTQLALNPRRSLARLDASVARRLRLDIRLLYGFAVPVVIMSLLICLMMISGNVWVMGATVLAEVLMLVVVIAGFLNVVDDPEEPV